MEKMKKLKGKAWVFGDILDVDWDIISFETLRELRLQGEATMEEMGKYCMAEIDPDYSKKVKKGDFIIAGENMGYGHDHETAPISIKGAGVGGVICASTNRNFLRNAIHVGLPVIEYKNIKDHVTEGDILEVDLRSGTILNLTTDNELTFPPYPDFLIEIIEAGGLYTLLKNQIPKGEIPIYARGLT